MAAQNPEVIKHLQALAEKARADLGDNLTGRKGTGRREVGKVEGKATYPDSLSTLLTRQFGDRLSPNWEKGKQMYP